MDSPSNVYRVYHPIRSDQTKAPILGGLWIVHPIYIEFINSIGKVKYLLVHYKEELKILQQNITTSWVSSVYHSQQGRQIINMRLGGLQSRGC